MDGREFILDGWLSFGGCFSTIRDISSTPTPKISPMSYLQLKVRYSNNSMIGISKFTNKISIFADFISFKIYGEIVDEILDAVLQEKQQLSWWQCHSRVVDSAYPSGGCRGGRVDLEADCATAGGGFQRRVHRLGHIAR